MFKRAECRVAKSLHFIPEIYVLAPMLRLEVLIASMGGRNYVS